MIIECKSCDKKFNVPDNAIPATGRLVQCSNCGNKWTQYPLKTDKRKISSLPSVIAQKKIVKKSQIKKKKTKTKSGPTIYSSEYLEKKHGIKINQGDNKKIINKNNNDKSYGLGFYSSIIIFTIFLISFFGILNLTKEIVIFYYPFLESYILYLYETIENIKIIITDFLSVY